MTKQNCKDNESLSQTDIRDIATAFQKSRILLTAYELNIFTHLENNEKSSQEIAALIQADPRATDRLMNALCAINLLKKKDDKFSNMPISSKFLMQGKPEFSAGLMHIVNLWDTWSTLTDAVRKGRSVLNKGINDRGDTWLEAFIAAMHDRAKLQADKIIAMLDLSHVFHVLDIGGGSGVYSMAFVRAHDTINATVFDLPNVVPITNNYIKKEGLADKIKTVIGDYTTDSLGSGYDLIFLSAIIHSNSVNENKKLIHKAAKALNAGGQIVIQDFIMDENRTNPPHGAFFALNMLVGTEAGDTYTENEISDWMKDAGLSHIIRKDTNFGTALIIGKKI